MKRLRLLQFRQLTLILVLILLTVSLYPKNLVAQNENFTLLKESISFGNYSSVTHPFYNFQDQIYFSSSDTNTGYELWSIDTTSLQTKRVADLRSGSDSSDPANFIDFQGKLFFTANQTDERRILWQFGSPFSVPTISEITTVLSDTESVGTLFPYEDHLLFASYLAGAWSLWQTDGTITGTTQLTTQSASFNSVIGNFTDMKGILYFVEAYNFAMGASFELWRTDGTKAGTFKIAHLGGGKYVKVIGPFIVNDKLFFLRGPSPELGKTIISSDGTTAGTTEVAMIPNAGYPEATTLKNRLLIAPDIGELWYSDGDSESTAVLKDINASGDSNPANLVATSDYAYFVAKNETGNKLWSTDGRSESTIMVTDTLSGATISNPVDLQVIENQLYFLAGVQPNHTVLQRVACDGSNAKTLSDVSIERMQLVASTTQGMLLMATKQSLDNGLWLLRETPNGVIRVAPTSRGTSGQFVTIPIELSNSSSVSMTGIMTVTATISDALTYHSDTSGISPTVQSNTLVWNLPVSLSGCRNQRFDLTLGLPEVPIGTTYQTTVNLDQLVNETTVTDNQSETKIVISAFNYLPLISR